MEYLILIIIGIVGIWIGYKLAIKVKERKGGFGAHNVARREQVEEAKRRIMGLFEAKEQITNDNVEELLKISNTTTFRYLEELEREGKIKQVGNPGRSVFYKKT